MLCLDLMFEKIVSDIENQMCVRYITWLLIKNLNVIKTKKSIKFYLTQFYELIKMIY